VLSDDVGEAENGFVHCGRDRFDGEALECVHECVRETLQPVTVAHNAITLYVVEHATDLFWGMFLMIKERNELCDCTLKVDIVFPERIVGVDEESLSYQLVGGKTHAVMCYCEADLFATFARADATSTLKLRVHGSDPVLLK
jgi:hypothetical protein